jgi:hypothetical protein
MLIELSKLGQLAKHAPRGHMQMMPTIVAAAQAVVNADLDITPIIGPKSFLRNMNTSAVGVPNVTVQQAGNHGGLLLALTW